MTAGRREQPTGGWSALREAVLEALRDVADASPSPCLAGAHGTRPGDHLLLSEPAVADSGVTEPGVATSGVAGSPVADSPVAGRPHDDRELATSSEESEAERTRLIALVELARGGDRDAFGELYDHYHPAVYRFLHYRTRSQSLAEDLAADTFFRALRNMEGFRWQGRDFGAWLMTIARNLTTDHFKASRTRLESTTEDMTLHDDRAGETVEATVMTGLTNEMLAEAMTRLPDEQQECLLLRFLQGMSIAETAAVLGRSEGAVKQLQLRGVRNLAKLVPEGIRD